MKIIGITGGVGSGKSEILKILKEDYQAEVIMADAVAHELMEPGAVSYTGIVQAFGTEILKEDQSIDRQKLGGMVFADQKKLSQLNKITHGNVDREILSRIQRIQNNDARCLLVIETALLVGAAYEQSFDQLWYVFVRENLRFERLKGSRGYSDEKIRQMIQNQRSEEEFKKAATHIIDNSGTIEQTREQIHRILRG